MKEKIEKSIKDLDNWCSTDFREKSLTKFNEKIKKNKKLSVDRWNFRALIYILIVSPFMMYIFETFIFTQKNPSLLPWVFIIFGYLSSASFLIAGSFFSEKLDSLFGKKKLIFEETMKEDYAHYLKNIVLPKSEMEKHYQELNKYFSKEELLKFQRKALVEKNQEVGSYYLIMELYELAIEKLNNVKSNLKKEPILINS